MINHDKILDKLKLCLAEREGLKRSVSVKTPNKGDYLGQEFREGDSVYERGTGKEGTVITSYTKRIIPV